MDHGVPTPSATTERVGFRTEDGESASRLEVRGSFGAAIGGDVVGCDRKSLRDVAGIEACGPFVVGEAVRADEVSERSDPKRTKRRRRSKRDRGDGKYG